MANNTNQKPLRRTSAYRDIYANQTLLTYTGTDVQVALATVAWIEEQGEGSWINEQHATLFLSPAQAKFLGMALQRAVELHEKEFGGKVTVPAGMLEWVKTWDLKPK